MLQRTRLSVLIDWCWHLPGELSTSGVILMRVLPEHTADLIIPLCLRSLRLRGESDSFMTPLGQDHWILEPQILLDSLLDRRTETYQLPAICQLFSYSSYS